MAKKFYLKERHNPQFDKPYYVKEGLLTKSDAKKREMVIYGKNYMLPFDTEQDYNNEIERLSASGFNVH